MIRPPTSAPQLARSDSTARLAFAVTVLLFLISAFLPNWRLWGFSTWKILPAWSAGVLVAVGALMLFAETRPRIFTGLSSDDDKSDSRRFWLVMSFVTVLLLPGFYVLRARTHFLGDGYTLLATLASDLPAIKDRELGAGLVLVWLKSILSGDPNARALLSYQIVSIVSGIVFIALTALCSWRLFADNTRRVLFCLGILTGGYMLQFFGYVENYTLFLVSIAAFVLVGLLAVRGRVSRWWILVPLGFAIFFHVIGLLLVPPAMYLLLSGRRISTLERLGGATRWGIGGLLLAAAVVTYLYLYKTSIFFRLAFLPIQANQFTIGGYTLFSPAHLLDLINLLILLIPGVFILVLALSAVPWRKVRSVSGFRFLLFTVACTLGGALVFDPKLGMPRDWDLFSFAGIPLIISLYWVLLSVETKSPIYRTAAILAVAAGAISLGPRVVAQHVENLGVNTFKSYLELDPGRARTGMYLLSNYYQSKGDEAAVAANEAERKRRYPTEEMIKQAIALRGANRVYDAKSIVLQVLQMDPNSSDAWTTLSKCYVAENRFDSALFAAKMADGLNPNNYHIQNDLALAYCYNKQIAPAEKILMKLTRDSAYSAPWVSLARLNQLRGNDQEYGRCLEQATAFKDCGPGLIRELAEWYAGHGEKDRAARTISAALAHGLDSASYQSFVAKYLSVTTAP